MQIASGPRRYLGSALKPTVARHLLQFSALNLHDFGIHGGQRPLGREKTPASIGGYKAGRGGQNYIRLRII